MGFKSKRLSDICKVLACRGGGGSGRFFLLAKELPQAALGRRPEEKGPGQSPNPQLTQGPRWVSGWGKGRTEAGNLRLKAPGPLVTNEEATRRFRAQRNAPAIVSPGKGNCKEPERGGPSLGERGSSGQARGRERGRVGTAPPGV